VIFGASTCYSSIFVLSDFFLWLCPRFSVEDRKWNNITDSSAETVSLYCFQYIPGVRSITLCKQLYAVCKMQCGNFIAFVRSRKLKRLYNDQGALPLNSIGGSATCSPHGPPHSLLLFQTPLSCRAIMNAEVCVTANYNSVNHWFIQYREHQSVMVLQRQVTNALKPLFVVMYGLSATDNDDTILESILVLN